MVVLLLIHCLSLLRLLVWGFVFWPCFYAVHVPSVLSSFAIISLRKRELVVFLLLSSRRHVAACVLCLFFMVGLQCVIVAFPGQRNSTMAL